MKTRKRNPRKHEKVNKKSKNIRQQSSDLLNLKKKQQQAENYSFAKKAKKLERSIYHQAKLQQQADDITSQIKASLYRNIPNHHRLQK